MRGTIQGKNLLLRDCPRPVAADTCHAHAAWRVLSRLLTEPSRGGERHGDQAGAGRLRNWQLKIGRRIERAGERGERHAIELAIDAAVVEPGKEAVADTRARHIE